MDLNSGTTMMQDSQHREPRNEIKMSQNPAMCRICLTMNVRMITMCETPLQNIYEKIVDAPLLTADMRPVTACYICYSQLQKFHKLMTLAAKSENILTEMLETYPEVSKRSAALISHQMGNLSLTTIPVEYFDTSSFDTSTKGFIAQDGVKLKSEKEYEDVEYEESVEPEITEFDIDVVKQESDMNSDMLWQNTDEAPRLTRDNKIEAQDDYQKDDHALEDTEDETEEISVSNELLEPRQDSTLPSIYQCKFCLRKFTNKRTYRKHIDTHEIHECDVCKHRFSTRNNLIRHLTTHSEEKPYQCQVCDRRFRLKHYLKRHYDIHSGHKYKDDYKCDICQRQFSQKRTLTAHLRTHTGEKPFECDVCQKRFAAKFNLQNHLRIHSGEKPYKCGICNARYIHRSSLRQHTMTHTGEKPHKCKVCKRGFTQSSHLKDHLKSHM